MGKFQPRILIFIYKKTNVQYKLRCIKITNKNIIMEDKLDVINVILSFVLKCYL